LEAQDNSPIAEGGLQIEVVVFVIIGIDNIIMVFEHFVSVNAMPGFIPMLKRSNVQPGKAEIGCEQGKPQINNVNEMFLYEQY